jgi:hypothetical protein
MIKSVQFQSQKNHAGRMRKSSRDLGYEETLTAVCAVQRK